MVIPDWTSAPKPPKIEFQSSEPSTRFPLARPLDRLAAVIVDLFVMLLPLFVLLSSPFKRWIMVSFLTGNETELFALIFAMVFLAAALIVIYQTLMHFFFRATIGKILFDLRVQSIFPGEPLTFWGCFARSIIWTIEILCLGLPMLAVFSNGRRRPLHDRGSDTIVVSRSDFGVAAPLTWERGLVRSFFGFCFAFVFAAGAAQGYDLFTKVTQGRDLASLTDKEGGSACETVSRHMSDETGEHARLETAMSLYAAGLADRACLEGEVEREIASQVPVAPVTYLAQAFINSDDAEVSNSYLDQVCVIANDSPECAMSKVVGLWSEQNWDGVNLLFSRAPLSKGYLEVWAVRNYMKQAQYPKALKFLDILANRRELADFTLVERVRALWNSYAEKEAAAAYAQALPSLAREQGEDLSRWLCAQQLQGEKGCDALAQLACKNAEIGSEASDIDFEDPTAAMSHVLAFECRSDNGVDYLALGENAQSEDWKRFFLANVKRARQNNTASAELYTRIIASDSAPEILKIESVRRLAEFATPNQMDGLIARWQELTSRETWVKSGNILLNGLIRNNKNDVALRVAHGLMSNESLSPRALSFLAGLERVSETRRPASQESKPQGQGH